MRRIRIKMMMRTLAGALLLGLLTVAVQAGNDYPHSAVNGVTCFSCHDIHGGYAKFLKVTNPHAPENIDDTEANNLCWSCHNDAVAPFVNPHSSHMIDDGYGEWAMQCITCHNPHSQEQYRAYDPESRLEEGFVGAVAPTTLTVDLADPDLPWEDNEFAGFIVYPNVNETEYSYRIVGNSSTTLDVSSGNAGTGIDLTKVSVGDTFVIVQGRLVKSVIETPNSGSKAVKFIRPTGANSFADADATYDGPCQVCHTQTNHMRNDGLAPDQMHTNADHDDPTGTAGEKCTEKCHLHVGGFGHGKGYTKADLCVECHGHEQGTLYDPDATYPYTAGTVASRGFGTTGPHTTHTESSAGIMPASAGDDDQRGPGIYCSSCHDIDNMPTFKSGTDLDADGLFSLEETDVCDDCHSPGGTYNGVDSTGESVGAKDNWNTGGVYDEDGILKAGKEKWCAGCHDDAAPEISGVTAPNVIGFESGAYTYGTGYGFYKTGHGLPSDQTYPAKAGLQYGAGKRCENCHDTTLNHIDGVARSFDCGTGNECTPTEYRESYRLKLIDDVNPLIIPRPGTGITLSDQFRLCFQSGCHDPDRFLIQGVMQTNFRDETRGDSPQTPETALIDPFNAHAYHLRGDWVYRFRPDWRGLHTDGQSLITCITCHNVHGSKQLSMIRDGRLIGKEPGFVVYYNNGVDPLGPSATTLGDSTATAFNRDTPSNVCENCHWSGLDYYQKFDRAAPGPQQVPTLGWTGEANYVADGIHPDSAMGGSSFVFRIQYTDGNGESPKYVQVWVDEDDSGTYESEEKYDMSKVDPTDLDYTDGALYRKTLIIARRGDGELNYRFYATDDKDAATGDPTANSILTLANNAPTLAWTGEPAYTTDGADPNSGADGDSFGFRIQYIDMDNEAPSVIQVWIDENDNSTYEAGEKYALTEVDAGDVDYTDGKLYTTTRVLSHANDGILNYRFYASDGTDAAAGTPAADSFVVVAAANSAPVLTWTGEADYGGDGVSPDSNSDCTIPEFRVKYTDSENVAPSSIQLWVDENDNDTYEAGEKYDMAAVDAGDVEFWNGKLYTKSLNLAYAGDGVLKYRFYASDGIADATGQAVVGSLVDVVETREVPAEYGTIQAAIDAAVDGDFVCVSDGAYGEQINFSNKAITVKSFNGAAATTIEGSGANSAVVVVTGGEGADSVLDGFTIDNQAAADGSTRGIYIVDSSPTIRNAIVQGNASTSGIGGGIYISGGGATIENSVIGGSDANKNSGSYGGGIAFVDSAAGTLSIRDSAITYNTAAWQGAGMYLSNVANPVAIENASISNNTVTNRYGGGIYADSAPLSIVDSHIDDNFANWSAGGLYLSSSTATFENSTVSRNSNSWGNGGGMVFVGTASTLTVNDSTIADNVASPFYGGGFHIDGTSLNIVINNSTISGNTGRSGGGLRLAGSDNTLSISDSRIISNIGAFGAGGLALRGGALTNTVTVERTVIAGNTANGSAGWGGGTYIISVAEDPETPAIEATFISATFTNCTVTGNTATPGGGGFYIGGDGTTVDMMNCTVAGNSSGRASGIHLADGGGATVTVDNSIIWGSKPSEIWDLGGSGTFTNSNIRQEGFEGSGNMTIDPLFVYPRDYTLSPTIEGNYHLQSDSPMLDKGTAVGAPTDDIDGDTRPQEGGIDLGSDEMVYTLFSNTAPELAWTGESMSYVADGVNPDTGDGGDSFEFRVKYTDVDDEAPASIQVWIDQNDDGTYDPLEKHSLTLAAGGDGDYTNGEIYAKTLPVSSGGDGNLNYRFYASDGVYGATGNPTSDSTIYDLTNVAPTLDWTGQTDYVGDGVNPDSDLSGSDFEFRMEFTDANNDMPPVIQVWVDANDNGTYEDEEKTDMVEFDADLDTTDGKFYTATIALSKAGDDSFNYRFYAADYVEEAVVGAPLSDSTVTVTNNPPVLAWTGETNYVSDGVNPDSESGGNNVEFRISYSDIDNEPPASIQVWVDRTDNGLYEAEEVELHDMFEVDAGDVDYTDGKLYSRIMPLIYVADGSVNYRFYATEGIDDATGTPTADSTATVTPVVSSLTPTLEWTGETGYTADGVAPDSGAGGANYTFRVKYTDDNAPAVIQVWVDEDDSGTYEADEKFAMGGADHTDISDADGKLYELTRIVPFLADGTVSYRFYASDGVSDATGAPTSSGTINVVDPLEVPGEYASIQAAIDAASAGNYVLVADGTYDENIDFNGKAITVQSLNGAAATTIDANNAVGPVVTFNSGETSAAVLDGFTLINGIGISGYGGGIYISGSSPTVKNSAITGHTVSVNGAGIYITSSSSPTITGVTVSGNTASFGGGLFVDGSSSLTLSDSTVTNNKTVWRHGGGIYVGSASAAISNTEITGNAAQWEGGGLYVTGAGANVTIDGSEVANNTGTSGGGLRISTDAVVTVSDSTIHDNSTGFDGAGVFTGDSGTLNLYRSIISGNQGRWGGGVAIGAAAADIENTTISGNRSTQGGGIYISSASANLTMTNSTVGGNYGSSAGGGLFANGTVTLTNAIFWGNISASDNEIYNTVDSANVFNSDIDKDGYDGINGSIRLDPLFVSPIADPASETPTTSGDYHLQIGSPAIDAGTATGAPADDIDGDSRPVDGPDADADAEFEMGSDEYVP